MGLPETKLKYTRWSEAAAKGETLKEYPRPSMKRDSWINLNGWWDYAITKEEFSGEYDGKILVPFSPESELSGVRRQLMPKESLWYHRTIEAKVLPDGYHYLLHFGAVDQICDIFLGGEHICHHEGGYLPFSVDFPGCAYDASDDSPPEIAEPMETLQFDLTIRVKDVSDTSYHSRGKQKLKRGGMYYTAQSGIWQTVWMEMVPDRYISSVKIDADPDTGDVHIQKQIHQVRFPSGCRAKVQARTLLESHLVEDVHLWSPEDPFLYHVTVSEGIDQVECYYAFRKLEIRKDKNGIPRMWLNGNICLQTGVLDQGYWCDGLYTAPSDEAMIYDIQAMKDLGFNMIRKHIKIEPERWYYHCDRLGILVWQDMVNGGSSYKDWFITYLATAMNAYHLPFKDGFLSRWLLSRTSRDGRKEYLRETDATIRHLYNHPSIVAWVPFNEGWGQFDAAKVADFVAKRDKTRWIDHASGWFDQKAGDMLSLHHYFFKLRFQTEEKRVLVLSEFGGYTWQIPDHSFSEKLYGYGGYDSREALTEAFRKLYEEEVLGNIDKGMSAFVYTQLSDVEEEVNGMLTYDREVLKFDPVTVNDLNNRIRTTSQNL